MSTHKFIISFALCLFRIQNYAGDDGDEEMADAEDEADDEDEEEELDE